MSDDTLNDEIIEQAPQPDPMSSVGGADLAAFENDHAKVKAALAKQPKVLVKVREDTDVAINGYGFRLQKNVKVKVPQQVADLLEEAGRI